MWKESWGEGVYGEGAIRRQLSGIQHSLFVNGVCGHIHRKLGALSLPVSYIVY